MRIAILGAGNMGCALATVLAANRHTVTLWSIEADVIADIQTNHRTSKYLPGVTLDVKRIRVSGDLGAACERADGVVIAVPSTVTERVARNARPFVPARVPVLSVAKGINPERFLPLPTTIATALGRAHDGVAGLAGPAVATEFAARTPTSVVVAGSKRVTTFWARVLRRSSFHVEESRDLVGISWAACLKNVYAIALGMCDGMQYTMNTKAMLTARALQEMAMMLRRLHADPATAYGLAGLGDLLTTGFSPHGRNRKFGEMICASTDCDIPAVLKTMTVEGVAAVEVARRWAQTKQLRFPIIELVWKVCHRRADPCIALRQYLERV
jgi:glycerol-3-phosphate dehydrogenase (NAD(P)+)